MSTAFHLEQETGLATLTFDLPDKKVNVFTREVLVELETLLPNLASRSDIDCLVLLSAKPGSFIAGADIEEISGVTDPSQAAEGSRYGQRLFQAWADLPFSTVAAIQGTCLGGGTEIALASDYILLSDRLDLRIGLPEVRIGIVPAWGGCTRLPRRIGLESALDIILAGKAINSRKAYKIGLADALLPEANFLLQVHRFASQIGNGGRPPSRKSDLKSVLLEQNPLGRAVVFNQARKQVLKKTHGHYPAPLRAIEVIDIGLSKGMKAGFEAEARTTGELAVAQVSKNLIHVFYLMESNKRELQTVKSQPIEFAAVLGAGVMGGGISQLISQFAAVPIRIKDLDPDPLAKCMAHAAELFGKLVKRRRMSRAAAKEKMALLQPTINYSGFEKVDFVIEAIVENLDIKRKVFSELATQVAGDAILASNTSSLSIDLIAQDTTNPDRVVGMHFFNPVEKMPLVEVIRGTKSSDMAVNKVASFARTLGKTPVIVKDGPGFLVNRLLSFYMAESMWLVDDGYSVELIDRTMTDWGMPMGPMALIDEVGIDVAVKVAHIMADAVGDRLPLPPWVDRLGDSGRLGKKGGLGIYHYDNGKRQGPDDSIYELLKLPVPPSRSSSSELVDRMVLPMVNEAARCLQEQIVRTAGDLDLAMIMGTGFPPFRGGLCRWADHQSSDTVVAEMTRLAASIGPRFRPAKALLQIAKTGGFYASYP